MTARIGTTLDKLGVLEDVLAEVNDHVINLCQAFGHGKPSGTVFVADPYNDLLYVHGGIESVASDEGVHVAKIYGQEGANHSTEGELAKLLDLRTNSHVSSRDSLALYFINISDVGEAELALGFLGEPVHYTEGLLASLAVAGQILGQHLVSQHERILLERNLEEKRAIIDHITDGLLLLDRDCTVRFMNKSAGRMLSLVPEQAIGKNLKRILSQDLLVYEALDSGEGYVDREVICDLPNNHIHLIDTVVPIKDREGKVQSVVNTFREFKRLRKITQDLLGNEARFTFDDIVGEAKPIKDTIESARKAAAGQANILLTGESGTGKELFAQAIHSASSRCKGPFVAINCAALARELIESELFGFAGGSFTGADRKGRTGKFELASGGTMFLDEIGEMPTDVQAKLLRVIQEREVTRVGDNRRIPIDVRIISATNTDLRMMVDEHLFRQDLYFRINVIGLRIPTLRERAEDIQVFVNHFIQRFASSLNKSIYRVSDELLAYLVRQAWPGNIRELSNTVEKLVHFSEGPELTVAGLEEIMQRERCPSRSGGVSSATPKYGVDCPLRSMAEHEAAIIKRALTELNYNVTKASEVLCVSRPTLYEKIRKYQIELKRPL